MKQAPRYGFNAIELAVATAVVMLFVLALLPAVNSALGNANVDVVGTRGRDLFVAITGANTEREPLGLPSVWPSEDPPITSGNSRDAECFNFSNSTDYFNYLLDAENGGASRWSPFVVGVDFSRFAGGGVPVCPQQKLEAENNLWTIAMNVTEDLADIVPILITRNIDASSLAAKVTDEDWYKTLRFDPEWETPFRDQAFVIIRKGGSVFKARAKYASYRAFYLKQTFDATVSQKGVPVVKPLKYLTPTRRIVPGEGPYAEGAARVGRLTGGVGMLVRRDLAAFERIVWPVGWLFAVIYLLMGVVYHVIVRGGTRRLPPLTGYGIGVGLFHYAAAVLWVGLFLGSLDGGYCAFRWTLLGLALLAQAVGIAFAAVLRRDGRAARQAGIMWMVIVPPIAVGSLFLLLVLGAFARA